MKDKYVVVTELDKVGCPSCTRYVSAPRLGEIVSVTDFKNSGGFTWFRIKDYEACLCGLKKWCNSKFFRPLDDVLDEISIEEILENELVEV